MVATDRTALAAAAQNILDLMVAARQARAEFPACLGRYLDANIASDLAIELGVSAQYLSDLRHGRRAVTERVLNRMAAL